MLFPIIEEILFLDPVQHFSKIHFLNGSVLLESADKQGRYSYIGVDPFEILQFKNSCDPFSILEKKLKTYYFETHRSYPPFQGGAMGFFSYDLIRYLEAWPKPSIDDMQFPDLCIGLYDLVIAFDHQEKKSFIFSSGFPEQSELLRMQRAETRIQWLLNKLKTNECFPRSKIILNDVDVKSNFSKKAYCAAVRKVKNAILEGDIFEANISQRFKTPLPENLNPFEIYLRLRKINPAPFSGYLSFQGISLVSASPERFIKKRRSSIEVRPIKGTRPRGKNKKEDQRLANELLQSEKDKAENVMIVDLMRNDLSKVCKPDSVSVEKCCGLESFSNVHHLVSVVIGEMKSEKNAIDLLRATFPGGSVTGAPKIRAMEIISEIESVSRGPYCGCFGYIAFNGDLDLAMTIRTFCINKKWITFQAGGAIVLDSIPEDEYQETLDKVKKLKDCLFSRDFHL